jgi:hypothetical protein
MYFNTGTQGQEMSDKTRTCVIRTYNPDTYLMQQEEQGR